MNTISALFASACLAVASLNSGERTALDASLGVKNGKAQSVAQLPIGQPGQSAQYRHETDAGLRGSVVRTYTLTLGPIELKQEYQWILLHATEANGEQFRVWLLSAGYPSEILEAARPVIARYILQENASEPLEYRNRFTGEAVLPTLGVEI